MLELELDEIRYWVKEIIVWQKEQKRLLEKAQKANRKRR